MRLLRAGHGAELSRDAVAEILTSDGLILIKEAGVDDVRDLLAGWTVPVRHPHQREAGLTIIAPSLDSDDADVGLAGFGTSGLTPHTDRSLHPDPPSLLAAVMLSPDSIGGDGLLVDGARVLATLYRTFGRRAVASLRLRASDGTTVPVVQTRQGLVRIRFRCDQVASVYSETCDEAVLDGWRSLMACPTRLPLGVGDGYLVHNHRFLHGRSGFGGPRRLARILARVDDVHRLAWLNEGFRVVNS